MVQRQDEFRVTGRGVVLADGVRSRREIPVGLYYGHDLSDNPLGDYIRNGRSFRRAQQ